VGALFGMKTIMDVQLKQDEYLVMQAGTHTDAVKLRRADWERLCEPVVAAIAAG
jgi:Ala-tRNA(Pro) deacylase